MQIFFWKKNKLIDGFAISLANDLFSVLQPEAAKAYVFGVKAKSKSKSKGKGKGKGKEIKADARIKRKISDLILRIKQFKADNSIGVYGKARIHMQFSNRLVELGYDEETAKLINEIIMLRSP